MKDEDRTKEQLIAEVAALRRRVAEMEAPEAGRGRMDPQLDQGAKSLQDRANILVSILDCVPDGVVAADKNGQFLLWNPAAERIIGKGAMDSKPHEWAEAYGDFLPDMMTPFPTDEMPLVRAIRGESTDAMEMFVRHEQVPEGIYISVTGIPLKDEKDDLVGGIAVFHDVTQHKRADAALRQTEKRYYNIFEGAAVSIWEQDFSEVKAAIDGLKAQGITDFQAHFDQHPDLVDEVIRMTKILDVNDTSLRLYGAGSKEELMGSLDKLFLPESRQTLLELLIAMADGETYFEAESAIKDLQGNRIDILVTMAMYSVNREFDNVLVSSIDITQRKQAERALQRYTEELSRSNAELEQFAYVASHDLQEPTRKVQAFGDRLEAVAGDALGDRGRDYLDRMKDAAGRMQTLINNLLTYSRVTTRAQPFVPVELSQVARGVLSDLEVKIEKEAARVEVGDLPTIDADPTQMRQLLQNLIGNSLKFHREGETAVVKVHGELLKGERQPHRGISHVDGHLDGRCRIIVEDNGIGFDEKYLDRIFTIFQRLHGRNEYEGTGIGLAVCRKIAERHGGDITAKSAPGHGATFIVTLPAKQDAREAVQ